MTDHAKALADALRDLRDWADEYTRTRKAPTYDAIWPASKALAAYDAHPAEAATRENGAPKKSYTMAVATDVLAWFTPHLKHIVSFHTLCEAMERILSTHQQQGAESELREALEQSVRLQSHYASLLNAYDGGKRMEFPDVQAWLDRCAALAGRREL